MMNFEYAYACVLAVIAYFGFFCTILLIFVLLKEKLLTEVSFILMFSLALADIGNLSVMTFHSLPEKILGIDWPDFCERAANRATLLFWYAALGHYLIMAANRFVAVRYPFKTNLWFSVKRTITYIITTWIIGICACAVPFFDICCDQIFAIHENLDQTIENATNKEGDKNFLKEATNLINVVVIVVLIFIYILTYTGINKTHPSSNAPNLSDTFQQNEIARRAKQSRLISLQFVIISSVFGFLVISEALSDLGLGGITLKAILQLAFTLNAGANVFIYTAFNSTFRKSLLSTILCCKKNAVAGAHMRPARTNKSGS
jgi:hypothetical protein